MEYDYEYLAETLPMLFTAKTLYDCGRMDIIDIVDDVIDPDNCYTFSFEALEYVSDFWAINYSEDTGINGFYFSDESIMEYYRLCRTYSKQKGISFKENPFMLKAQREVYDWLSSSCYYCYFRLQTKVNHKWASGIVFYFDENFYEFDSLLQRMVNIIDFFRCEVVTLRKQVKSPKIIALPLQKRLVA